MHLKNLHQTLKAVGVAAFVSGIPAFGHAAVNYYECQDLGFISATYKTKAGVIATSNRGSEIYALKNDVLTPLVKSPGAGMYVNVSKDGKYVGFKSINLNADQAPALLDVETGAVTFLEGYVSQCGQVSFADDGTMAYTMGNELVVRKGDSRKTYDLGEYVNIANISPDGKKVAYTNLEGYTHLLDVATGRIDQIATEGAYRAIWSPDNSKLAVQQVDGSLFAMDTANQMIYPLGKASSVSWTDNSQELVITRSELANDFEVKGASVVKMAYNGSNATTLVPLSESTPIAVTVSGNEMLVSYAAGAERGVTRTVYNGNMRAGAPAKVTKLLAREGKTRIGEYVDNNFGGIKRPDYSKMTEAEREATEKRIAAKAPAVHKGNDIGLTAIPYINQVYDTPAIGGSTAYGYVCCAPSSSCMMLGYYGLLTAKNVTSRASNAAVKTCKYSWCVSQQYTSKTGYTFSTSTSAGGYWGYTYGVKGGYGYMWGNGSPASHMASFHTNNGVKSSWFESSWSRLVTECNANRPYIICLANGTGGHVVCVFRANQIAQNDGSSTYTKTGSFICHDPYGDYNNSSYPNWDGRYSSYDWPGYSNGRANIGTFYWGCVTQANSTPATTTPTITVSPASVKFNCKQNENPTQTITVKGSGLSSTISIGSITPGRFATSVTSLPKEGGTFTITFAKSDVCGTYCQGGTGVDYNFFVRVKSGTTEKLISITAEVTAPPLSDVNEKYNYSVTKGNANANGYDLSKIRNFCYNDGKLYCVYDSKQIIVLNAQTGAKLGELSNGDVVGPGRVAIADVKAIDGVIVASNIATTANNDELRLYAWESDTALPYLLYSTTDFQGADRLGDCLEMTGTFATDCWFAFGRDNGGVSRIVEYNRKDGAWTAKNTVVYNSDGKQYSVGDTFRAYPKSSGWWVDGKGCQPAWVTWDDSKNGAVVQCQNNVGQTRGSSHHEFYWKGQKYAANLYFEDANGSKGRMRIIQDNTGNFSTTTLTGYYPEAGLGGAGLNPNGTGDVMINTDGQTYLEAWVLSTGHGLAYFTTGSVPTKNPQPFVADEPAPAVPTIRTDATSLAFEVNEDETAFKAVRVNGGAIEGNISVYLAGNDADKFNINTNSLIKTGGTVNVTYAPGTWIGNHTASLVLEAEGAETVTIPITGKCIEIFSDDITADKIEEKWVSSSNATTKDWHSDAETNFRDIAVVNGKLYSLSAVASATGSTITVADAYTGEKEGTLSLTGTKGGLFQIGALCRFDGKLIGSNVANTKNNLYVYSWDNEKSEPKVILESKYSVDNETEMGNSISASGTWENGRIWVAPKGVQKVLYFEVKNGVVDPTVHEITLKDKNGAALAALGADSRGAIRVYAEDDGSFWATAYQRYPIHYAADGSYKEEVKPAVLGSQNGGTDFKAFKYGSKRLAVATTYASTNVNGKLAIVDVTNGIAAATAPIATLPSAGLGSTGNSNRLTSALYDFRHGGKTLDMWVGVSKQGIAHYEYWGGSTGIDDIAADADEAAEAEYYNLQGVRMDAENLQPGLYIKRQGKTATKVVVK